MGSKKKSGNKRQRDASPPEAAEAADSEGDDDDPVQQRGNKRAKLVRAVEAKAGLGIACEVCEDTEDADTMLLCEKCDKGESVSAHLFFVLY